MDEIVIAAPAKLNLFLEVLARRPDGFHEVETVLATASLLDTVRLARRPDFEFACADRAIPSGEENLVVRAARAWERATGRPLEVRIELEKRIPVGAGLGGGSSDAAAVLAGLDRLFDEDALGADRLATIAAGLGSDVPFFLAGAVALGRGRGEVLLALEPPPPRPCLVAVPPVSLSTAEVYARIGPALTGPRRRATIRRVAGVARFEGEPFNRFEDVVLAEPAVRGLRDRLLGLGARPALTGTGSALFAFAADEDEAGRWWAEASRWPECARAFRVHSPFSPVLP